MKACDRCKTFSVVDTFRSLKTGAEMDLCGDCLSSFEAWRHDKNLAPKIEETIVEALPSDKLPPLIVLPETPKEHFSARPGRPKGKR